MTETNKGYRRVQLSTAQPHTETPPTIARPSRAPRAKRAIALRLVLAALGAVLLFASGWQLVELMANAAAAPAARTAMGSLPRAEVAWTTVAGAVLMPIAAVFCFVAFGAVRTRAVRLRS